LTDTRAPVPERCLFEDKFEIDNNLIMGSLKKKRKTKINKHKRRKRMKANRHKKRLRYKS